MSLSKEEAKGCLGLSMLATVVIAVVIAALLGLGFLAFQLHWFYAQKATNNQEHIVQHGVANQSGLTSEVQQEFTDLATLQRDVVITPSNKPFDKPQIIRTANQICAHVLQLDEPSTPWRTWSSLNCTNGALSPSSHLLGK